MTRKVTFSVQLGDALEFDSDVLALKHAQAFMGVDRAVAQALRQVGFEKDSLRVGEAEFLLVETRGSIKPRRALFVGTVKSSSFSYPHVEAFAGRVLEILAVEAPTTKHLTMTLHGGGFGLDEIKSFLFQCNGLLKSCRGGIFPERLEQISILHTNLLQVEALGRSAQTALGTKAPLSATPGKWEWEIPVPEIHSTLRAQKKSETNSTTADRPRAEDKISTSRHAFVAMSFDEQFKDVYNLGIEPAVTGKKLICERTDKTVFTGEILKRIKTKIQSAAVVIAEVSEANPNVYLEIGYAWGKDRKIVLVTKEGRDPLYAVRWHKHICYPNIVKLERALAAELSFVLSAPSLYGERVICDHKPDPAYAYVAMPWGDSSEDTFHFGIQTPLANFGLKSERVDRSAFPGQMAELMRNSIAGSSLVIAELTGVDPEVYFQLGYAWAIDKPTVLLVRDEKELAYDVKGYRCLTYRNITELKGLLTRELEGLRDQEII
jgi:nucleoside 2-deoxyribosyltransferase